MRKCEYCDTPFAKGAMSDIGVGFMRVAESEPNCDCYEETECFFCNMPLTKGELKIHYSCVYANLIDEVGDE